MRPLSLTIEGFTAFRDRQEVDFESLELFVITGPTGAGKTSILDAIAFALYGEVPRIGSRKGTGDIISLGSNRASVEFEFRIGAHGRHRVARRITRRTGQTIQSATLERQERDDWVPVSTGGVIEANQQIQELVGLDFDGFTRAVILPQGEFHRFLKGETADRRKVLFSLLGVSYFQRMGALARAKCADLEAGVKRTEDVIEEHYGQATKEHLQELLETAGTAASTLTAISAALTHATDLATAATAAGARVVTLKTAAAEISHCAEVLRDSLDGIRGAETAHAQAAEAVEEVGGELEAARAKVEQAEADLDTLCAEIGTLEDIATATAAAATVRDAAAEKQNLADEIRITTDTKNAAASELELALSNESEVVTELDRAAAEVEAAGGRLADAKLAAEALERAFEAATQRQSDLTDADDTLSELAKQLPLLRETAADYSVKLAHAREALEAHRRQHAVAELVDGLGTGDPCPVCGVALAELVVIDSATAETLDAAREADRTADAQREAAERAVIAAQTKLDAAKSRREQCLEQLTTALNGHADLAALSSAVSQAKAHHDGCVAQHGELEQTRANLAAIREKAQATVNDLRLRVTQQEAKLNERTRYLHGISERVDQAASVLGDRFGGVVPDDAIDRLALDRERVRSATELTTQARAERDSTRTRHVAATDLTAQTLAALNAIDLQLTTTLTNCDTVAAQATAASPTTNIGRAPRLGAGRVAAAEGIATWGEAAVKSIAEAASALALERDQAVDGVIDTAKAHGVEASEPVVALNGLKEREKSAVIASTKTKDDVEECERNIEARAKMETRIKADRERIALLTSLGQELQNNRFGDYIIDETLGLLCTHASSELKRISGGRYSLRAANGDFQVVDHANADESRSVKTLSGGETFLASLALALALSRHVGELAADGMGARLESVFIDEGFGTLDPATLDEVIDALERLRAEELVVGVISHVPELAQRIQSGLEVHQEGGRSWITPAAVI